MNTRGTLLTVATLVAGITGSPDERLASRAELRLLFSRAIELESAQRSGGSMMRAAVVLTFLGGIIVVSAQTPTLPAFEVASVRPSAEDSGPARFSAPSRGTTVITNGPLRSIITAAYGIPFHVERFRFDDGGRHGHILNARFDITAKPPDDAPPGQAIVMLRRLLAERFNLRVRSEMRQMPVYRITVARAGTLGPKLRPSTHDCELLPAQPLSKEEFDANARPFCRQTVESGPSTSRMASRGPMAQLAWTVQSHVDRPVIDATELSGSFEWEVSFTRPRQRERPSIFEAFREQLGLDLLPETGAVEVLVIDSVEMPTPN